MGRTADETGWIYTEMSKTTSKASTDLAAFHRQLIEQQAMYALIQSINCESDPSYVFNAPEPEPVNLVPEEAVELLDIMV